MHIFSLPEGVSALALYYYGAAQQLVCIGSDGSISTYADQGGEWASVSRIGFSALRAIAIGAAAAGSLLSAWVGAHRLA
jgi:hypothetical protein